MNYRQATHVFAPSFLGFPMNYLAAEGDPPSDVYCIAQFPYFGWFVSGDVVFKLGFYRKYTIVMINHYLQLLFGGKCMNSWMNLGIRVPVGVDDK